jgi:hypothetical protein
MLYWVSGIAKLESPWWLEGLGAYNSLSLDRYQGALGKVLVENAKGLLVVSSWSVLGLELLGPFALVGSALRPRLRLVVIAAFVALHAAFLLTMHLGTFPWLCLAMWVVFVPPESWDRRAPWVDRSEPPPGRVPERPLRKAFAAVAITGILLAGAYNVGVLRGAPLPRWLARGCDMIGLQQFWALFSPRQPISDGWFVFRGSLAGGGEANLLQPEQPVSFTRPELPATTFPNVRWRHYLANLVFGWPTKSIPGRTVEASERALAAFLCARWNQSHAGAERLARAEVHHMRHPLAAPDATPTDVLLVALDCPP